MTTPQKQEFASRLKTCRLDSGLSISRLAAEIGVATSTVSRAEKGDEKSVPNPQTFREIIRVFEELGKCTEDELKALEQAWLQSRVASPKQQHKSDAAVVLLISDLLDDWRGSAGGLAAFTDDLIALVNNWRDFQRAQELLDEERMMYDFARSSFERLLDTLRVGNEYTQPRLTMRVLYGLAHTRRYLGEAEDALTHELSDALELAKKAGGVEAEEHAKICLAMGNFCRRIGRLINAWAHYEESSKIFNTVEDRRVRECGLATIERKKAGTYLYQGEAELAKGYCQTSIKLCEECGDLRGKRKSQQHLAWALALLGYYNEAMALHEAVLQELGRRQSQPTSPLELSKAKRFYADVLRMCGNQEGAIDFYTQGLQDLRQVAGRGISEKETLVRGPILLGLGQVYRQMGAGYRKEAQIYLEQSTIANAHDLFHLARTHSELGKLALDRDDYQEAERRYSVAEKHFKTLHNAFYETAMSLSWAEFFLRTNRPADASEKARGVISKAAGNNNFKVHGIRGRIWLARAKTVGGVEDDPLADYFIALRIAGEDLNNQFLCREVLDAITTQLETLAQGSLQAELRRQYGDIKNWVGKTKLTNQKIQDDLFVWLNKTEALYKTAT